METNLKFLQTFSLVIAYWHALEKTWLKQVPWKLSSKIRTTFYNKFQNSCCNIQIWPFIFDICNDFSFQPILIKQFCHLLTKVWLVIFITSNKPTITHLDCQSNPTKLIIIANISCAPLHIHKSKFVVAKLQLVNFGKHNFVSFFPLN